MKLPPLAAGPHQKIGLRDPRRVEMGIEKSRRDLVRGHNAQPHRIGDLPHRPRDLVPRAVIEGDDQRHPLIVVGQGFRFLDHLAQVRAQMLALADHPHLDARLVQLRQVLADEPLHQAHQLAHLVDRPRPVLAGERVKREILDPHGARLADDAAHRLHPAPVALGAAQAPLQRPAPIAVHDDRHMPRHSTLKPFRRPFVGRLGLLDRFA